MNGYWLQPNEVVGSLPPANEVCEGYVFTGVCLSTWGGGVHGCSGGRGVRGCSRGVCVVTPGGHVWLLLGGGVVTPGGVCGCSRGVCMVAPRGGVGRVWALQGGVCDYSRGVCMVAQGGACVVAPGVGPAWLLRGGGRAWDTTRYR